MAALVVIATARRSRPAGGNFHLLAQMKVTKAKGLEHDLAAAGGSRPEAAVATPCWPSPPSACWTTLRFDESRSSTAELSIQRQQPDRIQALFFGSFLLGQQKKGSRRPGETGGLSAQEN
jgi:hypothetical protein